MANRSSNRTIGLALVLSIALHAMLLWGMPNPLAPPPPAERRTVVAVRLTSPSVREEVPTPEEPKVELPESSEPDPPEPEAEEREIELGLDAPNPPSQTWLGFTEYLKHLARKGEVEQAAFTDDPIAAAPPQGAASPMMAAPPSVDAPAEMAREESLESTPVEEASVVDHDPDSDSPSPEPNDGAGADTVAEPQQTTDVAAVALESAPLSIAATLKRLAEVAAAMRARAELHKAAAVAEAAAPEQARTELPRSSAAQSPFEPELAIAPRPMVGAPDAGARSDRESDPTSIVDVPRDQWQLGKPLAAQGLEIKPRRPDIPILTSLTAWPSNPLCRIVFDRRGVPIDAEILRSTGDHRIDAAIEASLYRWRAEGRQLTDLVRDQTVSLTIRLLINPSRRSDDEDDARTSR